MKNTFFGGLNSACFYCHKQRIIYGKNNNSCATLSANVISLLTFQSIISQLFLIAFSQGYFHIIQNLNLGAHKASQHSGDKKFRILLITQLCVRGMGQVNVVTISSPGEVCLGAQTLNFPAKYSPGYVGSSNIWQIHQVCLVNPICHLTESQAKSPKYHIWVVLKLNIKKWYFVHFFLFMGKIQ